MKFIKYIIVPPRRATQIKPEEEKPHPFNDRKAPQTKPEKEKPQHPCNDFKLSLAGEYGICANCKFTKHQHSDDAIFSIFLILFNCFALSKKNIKQKYYLIIPQLF